LRLSLPVRQSDTTSQPELAFQISNLKQDSLMASETCDVIVIGCGGFGSSAMYHLTRRGRKVIGIDRFAPPHNRGSSHGETRLIRKAYFEHPNYVPLLHRAWVLWEELADEFDEQLIVQRDLMMSGPPGSVVINGARESARLHSLPLENLTHEEVKKRYPMFRLPDDHSATVEPTAGFLWSERCVAAHLELTYAWGAEMKSGETVLSVNSSGSGVEVRTDRATYSAASAIMTCGAWTSQLLPAYARYISVLRKTLFWYPVNSPEWTKKNGAPMFLLDLPEGEFYGPGCVDEQTIKIGLHSGGEPVADPSHLVREIQPDDEPATNRFVTDRLVGIEPTACQSAVCMYSMSPDGHFLLDRLHDLPLVVAAGFSGHGFKFTSALGEVAADLAEHGRTHMDVDFLSASRLRI